mmetsp:Transcript_43415/g.112941  ORF Transcript_43415/g.112941 Transcript_43415/m.112941 type:complete len:220 (+) Transcript_43415:467-1126(+)
MGTRPSCFAQAARRELAEEASRASKNLPTCVSLLEKFPSLLARQRTSALFWPFSFAGRVAITGSSSFSCQKEVSSVTTLTERWRSSSGLSSVTAASFWAGHLWPTTTQARREVHWEDQLFRVLIFDTSTLSAGFNFFSRSSALDTPTMFTTRGLLALATTKVSGGESFSLNRWAMLRPLSVGSQHLSTPVLRPRLPDKVLAESSKTLGNRWFTVSLLTQ